MAQEHVELVRKLFEAHNLGGVEATLPLLPSDVRMYTAPEFIEDPLYRGHDGVRKVDALFADNFDEWGWELLEVRDAGDRAVAFLEMKGRIKDSGVPIRMTLVMVASDFRGGTVGELRFFGSLQDANEAVGLAE
jgi:ketosteroid isomerase-like protein